MRKLYAFIISAALLFGASSVNANASSVNANLENEIKKITENTPLVLQHADGVFDNDSIKWHTSHRSHGSHRSHRSHWSSY
jgi:PBP1b-binding outer membrane lipoprotein LpoB